MVLGFLVRQVFSFPLLVRNGVWRLLFRKKRVSYVHPASKLPAVGLDERVLQSIIFALRQASAGTDLVEAWLTATQLAQIVVDRLLADMRKVTSNLAYWQRSMRSRHHVWLMFFQRGPLQAVKRAVKLFKGNLSELISATDMIEQRILVLRTFETLLSKTLAEVNDAAVHLRLDEGTQLGGDERTLDLGKRAHVHVNSSLTKISNALRKLHFESSLLQDHSRMQRQMAGVTLSRSTPSMGSSQRQASIIVEDIPKDSQKSNYDIHVLHELIAKIKDRLSIDLSCHPNESMSRVMDHVNMRSEQVESFVPIPEWVRRPSRLQRHWIRYSIVSIIGFSCLKFLYNRSPLSGSDEMYKWAESTKFALDAHLVGPLKNLTDEIFDTFHGSPGIVSREDYELSKQSLLRMLKDFKEDDARRNKTDTEEARTAEDSVLEGMDTLMRCYESELKSPLKNVIIGQLARALLVQVQKLKVDTESAMLQLDQILRANELNVALVAAIPAILIAGGLSYFLFATLLNRSGPDPYKSLIPCRLALVELQRALDHSQEAKVEEKEAHGHVLYRVEKTYRACWNVFESRDITSERSEWPSLRKDFLDLSRPLPLEQKAHICERMRVNYSVFQIN